ncbi:MAG: peptide deformylase [Phycisphaeraceae bacterium]
MAVNLQELCIRTYPDPVLRRRADPVERVDDEVRAVARRMLELMHDVHGVGLAAPQVGLPWRLFVVNATGEPADDRVYINPALHNPARQTEPRDEGCLSIPGITAEVTRPAAIRIVARGLEGEPIDEQAEGLLARALQHEYDHLEGVLIIDRMTPVDRMANKRALRELEAEHSA